MHNVFTEKVNKIALSASDDKRLQTDGYQMDDRRISNPYDIGV